MKDYGYNYADIMEKCGKEIADATADFYSIFTGKLFEWVASLWDKESGGFYFSVSARDNEEMEYKGKTYKLLPDIESTSQAIGLIQDTGLTPDNFTFPEPLRTGVISFLQRLQDPEDGFFYHPQWGKDIGTSRRARDLGNATWVIEDLGARLLYPSAVDRMKAAAGDNGGAAESVIPEHLRSRAAFLEYLEGLNINGDSYSVGHRIAMQSAQIAAVGLTDVCIDFLNSHQHENGLWENELTYRASNGLLKICGAYNSLNREFPRLETSLLASIEVALRKDGVGAVVDVFNPLLTVKSMSQIAARCGKPELLEKANKIIHENAVRLISCTKNKLELFRKPDGGFSYALGGTSVTSQGVPVALPGYAESDMNATSMAKATARLLMRALGIDSGLPYTAEDGREFFALFE